MPTATRSQRGRSTRPETRRQRQGQVRRGGRSSVAPEPAYYCSATCDPTARRPPARQATRTPRVVRRRGERQNFANWYSYYRTRMRLMKSASGRAFAGLDDSMRVGFVTINEPDPDGSSFLKLDQVRRRRTRSTGTRSSTTPADGPSRRLRHAAARRAVEGRAAVCRQGAIAGDDDPVQYSCQQNFSDPDDRRLLER